MFAPTRILPRFSLIGLQSVCVSGRLDSGERYLARGKPAEALAQFGRAVAEANNKMRADDMRRLTLVFAKLRPVAPALGVPSLQGSTKISFSEMCRFNLYVGDDLRSGREAVQMLDGMAEAKAFLKVGDMDMALSVLSDAFRGIEKCEHPDVYRKLSDLLAEIQAVFARAETEGPTEETADSFHLHCAAAKLPGSTMETVGVSLTDSEAAELEVVSARDHERYSQARWIDQRSTAIRQLVEQGKVGLAVKALGFALAANEDRIHPKNVDKFRQFFDQSWELIRESGPGQPKS